MYLFSTLVVTLACLFSGILAQEEADHKKPSHARILHPHKDSVWHAGHTVSVHWAYIGANNTEVFHADLLRGVKHDFVFIGTLCKGLTPKSTSCTAKLPTDLWQHTYTVRVGPDFSIHPSDYSAFFLIKNPNDPRSTTTTTVITTTQKPVTSTTKTTTRCTTAITTTTTTTPCTTTTKSTSRCTTKTTTTKPKPTPPCTTITQCSSSPGKPCGPGQTTTFAPTLTLPTPHPSNTTSASPVPTPSIPSRGGSGSPGGSHPSLTGSAATTFFVIIAIVYLF